MRVKAGIGAMRDRVRLETPTQVRDAIGGLAVTWAKYADVWAYVNSTKRSNNRATASGNIDYSDTVDVTLQLFDAPTIKKNWRLVWKGEAYTIQSLVKDDIDNVIYLICAARED